MIAEERKKVNVLDKMEKNIFEFAELKRNRNRMARFLRGLSLNDFFFVGIQDFLEEDLKDLAQMLGWNICLAFHNNRNELKGAAITDKMRQKIEELNRSDIEIYKEALRIREFRRKKIGHPI